MNFKNLSVCFHTDKGEECKAFYTKYLGAAVTFDCGWYISIKFGNGGRNTLQFMHPQHENPAYSNGGVSINMEVKNVDDAYQEMLACGIAIPSAPQDNPWGDRSFTITDPIGNTLYIFNYIKPSGEYAAAFKK